MTQVGRKANIGTEIQSTVTARGVTHPLSRILPGQFVQSQRLCDAPLPQLRNGEVFLVGAGPGDPGFLTLAGLDALRQADVVVHDWLGCEEILQLAGPNTRLISVGKAPGGRGTEQTAIHEILIREARDGNRVVRLKGGDPFVFGRGMEEVLALEEAGIPVKVLPGVSSSSAAPLSAGIPVTHRGICRGFSVYTGHEMSGTVPTPGPADTRIFLMAMANLGRIIGELLADGHAPTSPAAIVSHASTYRQRTVRAPLCELMSAAGAAGIASPAVVIVGETVNFLDESLANPEPAILVAASRVPAAFGELFPGRRALWRPVHRIVPLQGNTRKHARAGVENSISSDWLVFTSHHAVTEFMALLHETGRDARGLQPRIAALGGETSEALHQHGLLADRTVVDGRASAAAVELSGAIGGGRVVVVCGEAYEGRLPSAFLEAGAREAMALGVYTSESLSPAAVDWNHVAGVYFASPRNVRHFVEAFENAPADRLIAWANGESAAGAARAAGFSSVVDVTGSTGHEHVAGSEVG